MEHPAHDQPPHRPHGPPPRLHHVPTVPPIGPEIALPGLLLLLFITKTSSDRGFLISEILSLHFLYRLHVVEALSKLNQKQTLILEYSLAAKFVLFCLLDISKTTLKLLYRICRSLLQPPKLRP